MTTTAAEEKGLPIAKELPIAKKRKMDVATRAAAPAGLAGTNGCNLVYGGVYVKWISGYLDAFDLIVLSSVNKNLQKLQQPEAAKLWSHLPPVRVSHSHEGKKETDALPSIKVEQLHRATTGETTAERHLDGNQVPWSSLTCILRIHFSFCTVYNEKHALA